MKRREIVRCGAGALGWMLVPRFLVQAAWGGGERTTMKIKLSSIFVDDQDKALAFYTEKLGFVKKHDVPLGEFKWLTLVSPSEPEGTELVLEPNQNPAAKTFQKALFDQGIPLTAFLVEDVDREHERLKAAGVRSHTAPAVMGPTKVTVLDDTCGNLIQLYQMMA